jgi:hypothetical protein
MAKAKKSCKIRIHGTVDYKSKTGFFIPKNGVEYRFDSDSAAYYGNTFTPCAAAQLVYLKALDDARATYTESDPILAIEFGRDSLLRILSQKGCEAVRFAFSKTYNDEGKITNELSLVAMGLDENGQLLRPESFKEDFEPNEVNSFAITEEKGNKVATSKVLKQMGITEDSSFDSFLKVFSGSLF